MALPGSRGYKPAETEVEAQNQITELLFLLLTSLNNIRTELSGINNKLQHISSRLH